MTRQLSIMTVVFMLASVASFTSEVRAQKGGDEGEMEFSIEETGGSQAPPEAGPPSEALAGALRLYQQGHHNKAAVQFQRVVESRDTPGNVQKAQFFLGKSLYHLGYYQSALALFDEIGQVGKGHLYFDQTLRWLAQLASQLPESAKIIEKVGRYGADQLDQFNKPETRDLYGQLIYMMGRYKYDKAEFETAIELFARVPKDSESYVNSMFFQGISHVRLRRAKPAVKSFRAIIEALDAGDVDIDDEERMRNLAWISLARVYYTASNRTDQETNESITDGKLLGQAVESWNQVDRNSEYWLDAVFESSWAFFLADEYSRALGNVHTLYSPYFPNSYYPEAMVIKAVTFFVNCQIDNSFAMIQKFRELYDPVRTELEETMAKYEDNVAFFEFLKLVRGGNAQLSPKIRGIVSSALSDRTLVGHLDYVNILDEEEARLNESEAAFKDSSLGDRINGDILLAKSFAIDEAGKMAKGRYDRLISELLELSNQVDAVELEAVSYTRQTLSQEMQQQMAEVQRSSRGDVEVDEEHQLWPFDGEYWRDELGFYRQQVTNQCGR